MHLHKNLISGFDSGAITGLLFSGGRDSTLAALRLAATGDQIVLITVTSGHLSGIEAVHQRLHELKAHLAPETNWFHIEQPAELATDLSFYEMTCLPCHHAYVVIAAAVALKCGLQRVAFGYVRYQNTWPEQTPAAIRGLTGVLKKHGLELILPVSDIQSQADAVRELQSHQLTSHALEQKCSRQVQNIELSEEKLIEQVQIWENAIDESIEGLSDIHIDVLDHRIIRDL